MQIIGRAGKDIGRGVNIVF